ncbi:MAG: DUF433 domain-containing protein [Pseudomonadota bacterium]|jgi:uncharacterized protein (DUF433 family)|nr:DUF433 domain-containing protein [Pseudomonadota bacterium]
MNRNAQDAVVSDPEILRGAPVLPGTRVPVHDVAASVAAGFPLDRILAAYPSLDADKIALAVIYAQACPAPGVARISDELPQGGKVIAHRRVPRRRRAG